MWCADPGDKLINTLGNGSLHSRLYFTNEVIPVTATHLIKLYNLLNINNKIINQLLTTIYINQFTDKNQFCPFYITKEKQLMKNQKTVLEI